MTKQDEQAANVLKALRASASAKFRADMAPRYGIVAKKAFGVLEVRAIDLAILLVVLNEPTFSDRPSQPPAPAVGA